MNWNRIILTCLWIPFIAVMAFGQVNLEWSRLYNGTANSSDAGNCIAKDRQGNVYVTGYSSGAGTDFDIVTIKYNTSGDSLWTRRYNGPVNNTDEANAIAVDDSGNVYVTGWSFRGSPNLYDIILIKYNTNGVQQWVQTYNGPADNWDRAYALAVDNAGGIYTAGYTYQTAGTYTDLTIIKYSSSGQFQWIRFYNGTLNSYDEAHAVGVDGGGNIYVSGFTFQTGTNEDIILIKYTPGGTFLWQRFYNSPSSGYDNANAMYIDAQSNIYLTGSGNGFGSALDMVTLKYDSTGFSPWARIFTGPNNGADVANALIGANGNIYITGYNAGSSGWDIVTVGYSGTGTMLWENRTTSTGVSYASSIAKDNNSNLYITGTLGTPGTSDAFTSKLGSWTQTYNGPGNGNDVGRGIVTDTLNNVFVGGVSTGGTSNNDMMTLKYSQIVGINPVSNEIPKEFKLEQNYPNPFNPSTKFKVQISKSGFVKLEIFNILGIKIDDVINQEMKAGVYEVTWPKGSNASNYASGVYYYRMSIDNGESSIMFTETKKMMLLK